MKITIPLVVAVCASFCSVNGHQNNTRTALNSKAVTWEPITGFSGPYTNIWDDQCTEIGTAFDVGSANDCAQTCVETTHCSAVNTNEDESRCEMWQCPHPVPEPSEVYDGWCGYKRIVVPVGPISGYDGPSALIWSLNQCTVIAVYDASEVYCAQYCQEAASCNAFIHTVGGNGCEIFQCPYHLPQPSSFLEGWVGYKKLDAEA